MPTRLFRRFGGQVREHNWIAAGVDLAIVITGVFLGIEAANWSQSQHDRSEERRYYAQIVSDLRSDLQTLSTTERLSRKHDRAAEATLTALGRGLPRDVNPGRFAADIHYAGFLNLPRPDRRTYDELISTGNLRLLRNERAKNEIAAYYAGFDKDRQWDELLRQQQSDYWRLTAGVVPRHVLQAAIRMREPNVTAAEANAILSEARRRSQMPNLLVGMAAHQERVRRDSQIQAQRARDLIRQLEALAR